MDMNIKKKIIAFTIIMVISVFSVSAVAETASSISSTVMLNGNIVVFDAYNINDYNYFKLRDLAYVLNGTEKQFAVDWDGVNDSISLASGQPYESVGGEMVSKETESLNATATSSKIYLDGHEIQFTAYSIEGYNYFKLRDVGEALNFGVERWPERDTIVIDTSKGYSMEVAPSPQGQPETTPAAASESIDPRSITGIWKSRFVEDFITSTVDRPEVPVTLFYKTIWGILDLTQSGNMNTGTYDASETGHGKGTVYGVSETGNEYFCVTRSNPIDGQEGYLFYFNEKESTGVFQLEVTTIYSIRCSPYDIDPSFRRGVNAITGPVYDDRDFLHTDVLVREG